MTLWRARCAVLVYIQIHINPYQRYTFMISFLHIKLYQILLCKRNKIAVICKFFMCDLIANIDCKLWLQIQLHFGSFVILQFAWAQENYSLKAGQEYKFPLMFLFCCESFEQFSVFSAADEELKFHRSNIRRCCEGRWVVLVYMEKQPPSIVKSLAGFFQYITSIYPIYHSNVPL